ncbi:MAG TPA: ABC transporter permease [Dehalococcoidia bacterium]|nr:ABC transporter permease [Dehalococcoidia bacterium]
MPTGLATYIARRLLIVPVVLLIVSFVAFALGRLTPSDYVEIQAGPRAQPETIERIREQRGLNDPIPVQYVRYMGNFVTGDFGTSAQYRLPVDDVILPRLWVTLQINVTVIVLTWLIAIPIGTLAALKRSSFLDPLMIGIFVFFASVPVLVSTPILQWLLASEVSLLPSGGWAETEYFGVEMGLLSKKAILPIMLMTLPGVAGLARYMRTQVIEVMDMEFVRTAQAKGLRADVVVTRHVMRNALLPIVTLLGFEMSALFAGSIFVETLLGIPGIGQYTYEAVGTRDYDGIMAVVILGSSMFVMAMLVVDVAYGFIDPRIRLGEGLGG